MNLETWSDATCRRYADHMRRVVPRDHRLWAKRIDAYLEALASDGAIAEIAAGPGFLLAEMGRLRGRARLIAVDSAPAMLRIADEEARRAGLRIETVQCDATQLRLPAAGLDVVMCKQLLNCMDGTEARRAVIAEMARVLRPGGLAFIIDFDAAASPWAAQAIVLYSGLLGGVGFARDFRAAWGRRLNRDLVESWMRDAGLRTRPAARNGVSFMLVGRKS